MGIGRKRQLITLSLHLSVLQVTLRCTRSALCCAEGCAAPCHACRRVCLAPRTWPRGFKWWPPWIPPGHAALQAFSLCQVTTTSPGALKPGA